jgi:glycosyltransferase involved in cell wall biosynthesis
MVECEPISIDYAELKKSRPDKTTSEGLLSRKENESSSYIYIDDCEVPDISIVIPVYNEEESIGVVLKMISEINWFPYTLEVIAVDDGSTDNTRNEISQFPFVKYVLHSHNMGKGAALKTGFRKAKGKVVVIQDADMEYSPESILDMVRPILSDTADVVFGSRFAGKYSGMSGSHFLGNKLLSFTASVLYDEKITDIMTGAKAFRRSILDLFTLTQDGFGVEIELTSECLRNGARYAEVPIGYSYRTTGTSKIRPSDGFKSLFKLFSSRFL